MTTYLALLRGINVGGKNPVPMAVLRTMFTELGHAEARTYIQSGNVVFRTTKPAKEPALVRSIEDAIASTFTLQVPVVVRTGAQLATVLTGNPFLVTGTDHRTLHVAFLAARPSAKAVAVLDPDRSAPDAFEVRGREIYLHYPNGSGRSTLTLDYFERTLGIRATVRNWKTVTTLLDLMQR